MATALPEYRLSPKVPEDLEAIWIHSLSHWGTSRAEQYIGTLIVKMGHPLRLKGGIAAWVFHGWLFHDSFATGKPLRPAGDAVCRMSRGHDESAALESLGIPRASANLRTPAAETHFRQNSPSKCREGSLDHSRMHRLAESGNLQWQQTPLHLALHQFPAARWSSTNPRMARGWWMFAWKTNRSG